VDSIDCAVVATLDRRDPAGFFEGVTWEFDDPYRFGPVLGELDDSLICEGTHRQLWTKLGSHVITHTGVTGAHFAVWAPNAMRVSVVGDFNEWDGRRHPMRGRTQTGVWEIFIPGLGEGTLYKYEIRAADGTVLPLKADPHGTAAELRPQTASVIRGVDDFTRTEDSWLGRRAEAQSVGSPISVYEIRSPPYT
jgi:1,4-alpha-glucan branching enzyme